MAYELLRTLLASVEVFQAALTRPGYSNALVVFVGWVLSSGPHAITQALVMTDVARRRHHERFHRFFSRGTWSPDEIGRLLFERILTFLGNDAPIQVALDDTLAAKKGPQVFGIGSHLDAVRSTKRFRVFCFGACVGSCCRWWSACHFRVGPGRCLSCFGCTATRRSASPRATPIARRRNSDETSWTSSPAGPAADASIWRPTALTATTP